MKKGYDVFLMIELARCSGLINKELEYDLIWERGCGLLEEFENSKFNREDKGLYECISEFLNSDLVHL